MLLFQIIACLFGSLRYVSAEVPADEVHSLPGWNAPLPTRQFSGYVPLSEERFMHYWLVESARDPEHDPLVLWVQGGPGCSSLLGYFTEVGPFQVEKGSGTPELVQNDFSWNRIANVLFWESPVGVGYSYTLNNSDYHTNDTRTEQENLVFLENFFLMYPEYRQSEFYIAGESYAGIFIPMLARLVLEHNQLKLASAQIPLKGLMIGNGCTGVGTGACSAQYDLLYLIPFLYTHAIVSTDMYTAVRQACAEQQVPSTNECARAVNATYKAVGLINSYNIYGTCVLNKTKLFRKGQTAVQRLRSQRHKRSGAVPIGSLPDCEFDVEMTHYLQREDVQTAMHVHRNTAPVPWSACSDFCHERYDQIIYSLLPSYPELLHSCRTLIYHGDVDAQVPYPDNEQWTSSMKFDVLHEWHPWMVDGQVAGYAVDYESDFTFATVKGAGHTVPQYKPRQAFAMFERFIQGHRL